MSGQRLPQTTNPFAAADVSVLTACSSNSQDSLLQPFHRYYPPAESDLPFPQCLPTLPLIWDRREIALTFRESNPAVERKRRELGMWRPDHQSGCRRFHPVRPMPSRAQPKGPAPGLVDKLRRRVSRRLPSSQEGAYGPKNLGAYGLDVLISKQADGYSIPQFGIQSHEPSLNHSRTFLVIDHLR